LTNDLNIDICNSKSSQSCGSRAQPADSSKAYSKPGPYNVWKFKVSYF